MIIITLWTVTVLTILVAAIAGQIRLSAQAAFFHREELENWANVLGAINQTEMELMLERQPRPPEEVEDLSEAVGRNPLYRYNGQRIDLAYPAAEDITVRVYDHAGKINVREISQPRMRALLEKRIGEDEDDRIDELLAAWTDWLDLNSGENVDGAERDYYESLDVPYSPRDGRIETVNEILHVRGFEEVFADVDLEAAFTLYTDDERVNLNLATVEAMRLLPGLNDELIEEIVAHRRDNEFLANGDVAVIVPEENMAELRPWLNLGKTSNFYTVMAYPRIASEEDAPLEAGIAEVPEDTAVNAFSEIIQVISGTDRPRILKVDPYGRIPQRQALPAGQE